ncbi:hypothetical protein [Mycobacterium sp. C31M]
MDRHHRRRCRKRTEPPGRPVEPMAASITRRLTAWLAAGALAVGLGAAVVSGAAVAAAETDSAGSDSSSSSASSSNSGPSSSPASNSAPGSDRDSAGDTDTKSGASAESGDSASASEPSTKAEKAAQKRAERRAALAEKRRAARQATQPVAVLDTMTDAVDSTAEVTSTPEPTTPESSIPESSTAPVTAPEPDASQVIPEPETVAPTEEVAAPETEVSTATPRAGPLEQQQATARPSGSNSPWDNLVRQFKYIFDNVSPTLQNGTAEQVPGTGVVGTVTGQSNNGFALTYRVRQQADYGTVTVDPVTGQYTYTAKPKFRAPGTVDYFVIEASNGTAARLPGLAGLAQQMLHSLAVAFGLARPDTTRLQVLVEFDGNGKYGTPAINRDYYVHQNDDDCAVMAVASVWGQLTGTLPTGTTESEFLDLVKRTPSVSHPGMMWVDEGTNGLTTADTAQLLRVLGFDVETYRMDEYGDEAGYGIGQDALGQLKESLLDGKGTITMISAGSMWSALGYGDGSTMVNPNHAISVIGIDLKAPSPLDPRDYVAVVYVNDSGLGEPSGQGMAVPLATFMWAWAASGYELIVADNPVPAQQQVSWDLAA